MFTIKHFVPVIVHSDSMAVQCGVVAELACNFCAGVGLILYLF